MRDMVRQRGAGDIQLLLNHAYRQAVVTGPHQQAYDAETGWIADLGEDIGGVVEFHVGDFSIDS
jgi:hypothetical protein